MVRLTVLMWKKRGSLVAGRLYTASRVETCKGSRHKRGGSVDVTTVRCFAPKPSRPTIGLALLSLDGAGVTV